MMRRVRTAVNSIRSVRISRAQLGVVTLVSAAASALVLNSALGHSDAQSAVLAALAQRPVAASSTPVGSSSPTAAPAVAVAAAPPASPPASSSPTAASQGPAGSTGAGSGGPTTTTTSPINTTTTKKHHHTTPKPKHQVGHVFVIALSTPSYEDAWGTASKADYLDGTLKKHGVFLGGYETLGSTELPDYLAMVSGQGPNSDTDGDCAIYSEFPTGTGPAKDGQVPGTGCVYPNTAITVPDQVTAAGKSWRGYIDGLTSQTCVHPNSGAADDAPLPFAGADYDTRHNPFIYFHSLLDLGGCSENDVSLNQLPKDLRTLKSTPAYSFIAPGRCDDGSAGNCSDGSLAGVAGEDAFLHKWVPVIEHSAAYRHDGVLMIVFALSGTPSGSDTPSGGGSAPVGALVLSRWAKAGQIVSATYNPYSVLLSTEDLLGLTPLVHASGAKSFLTEALPGT